MPRGQADFGMYAPKTSGATLADMGDLAVRLGSIVEYDRRGDIVFLDDFEEAILKWLPTAAGDGYVRLDSTFAKSRSQSVKLYTDDGAASTASIGKYFVVQGVLRVGVEISFIDLTDDCDFYFLIHYWDGTTSHRGRLFFDHSTRICYIEDTAGANWVEIFNYGALRREHQLFYPIKLVVDFVNDTYLRLLFGTEEYNLEGYGLVTFGGAGGKYFYTLFQLENTAAVHNQCWVDDFILTTNEP